MRIIITFIIVFGLSFTAFAQSQSDSEAYDLSTIDGTIDALYGSISGEKGVERDWETFASCLRMEPS